MKSPTGRIVDWERYRQQEDRAWRAMQRFRKAAIAAGAIEADMFDVTGVDFTDIEARVMAAMREDK